MHQLRAPRSNSSLTIRKAVLFGVVGRPLVGHASAVLRLAVSQVWSRLAVAEVEPALVPDPTGSLRRRPEVCLGGRHTRNEHCLTTIGARFFCYAASGRDLHPRSLNPTPWRQPP